MIFSSITHQNEDQWSFFFRRTNAWLKQQFSAGLELPVEYVGALYLAEVRAVEVGHGRRDTHG